MTVGGTSYWISDKTKVKSKAGNRHSLSPSVKLLQCFSEELNPQQVHFRGRKKRVKERTQNLIYVRVSSISHGFLLQKYWDTCLRCQCPVCKEDFHNRPELRVNTFISGLAAQFKQTVQFCTEGEHKTHNIVPIEEESVVKKCQLGETQAAFQQMIQSRLKKIKEVKESAKVNKMNTEKEKAESMAVFSALMSCIERSQAELLKMMEEKQKAAEKQAEEFIKHLELEITELKRRNTELEQLSHTEDHLHLLQIYPSLCSPPHTQHWTRVTINSHLGVQTLRTQLHESLNEELEKFPEIKLKSIQRYAVAVTLDPNTANFYLVLSDDGRQVRCGQNRLRLRDNAERFNYCACVLGKEGFPSGKFYYEVEVRGKTEWDLGVARKSVNRKGTITLTPENGYWSVLLRNGREYKAGERPLVPLSLKQAPQKVGVFVDYEEGLVSFYNVDAKSHIYSFTDQCFFEDLYPYFSPGHGYVGENSAPLVIMPAEHFKR
ncbi:hypothetical protein AMELA_G00058580 [Ameiurus melas]|uniref:B30.2/SPRY domain-containing protein n=1 Tax=Ameiurus melas TaxID=219545 RepID=A0A7J6B0X2_AMEME|nr:hypothetical protein AMELA_G00058580 [Ameiurus melas]